jgi:hypothetical protein
MPAGRPPRADVVRFDGAWYPSRSSPSPRCSRRPCSPSAAPDASPGGSRRGWSNRRPRRPCRHAHRALAPGPRLPRTQPRPPARRRVPHDAAQHVRRPVRCGACPCRDGQRRGAPPRDHAPRLARRRRPHRDVGLPRRVRVAAAAGRARRRRLVGDGRPPRSTPICWRWSSWRRRSRRAGARRGVGAVRLRGLRCGSPAAHRPPPRPPGGAPRAGARRRARSRGRHRPASDGSVHRHARRRAPRCAHGAGGRGAAAVPGHRAIALGGRPRRARRRLPAVPARARSRRVRRRRPGGPGPVRPRARRAARGRPAGQRRRRLLGDAAAAGGAARAPAGGARRRPHRCGHVLERDHERARSDELGAVLVGEPTGDALGGWGEVRSFTLPNSGIRVGVSSYRHGGGGAQVVPDVPAYAERRAWLDGVDPVLDAALRP